MARPHPRLLDLAAGRAIGTVDDPTELVRSAREHRMDGLLWSATSDGTLALDGSNRTALAERSLEIRTRQRALWRVLTDVTRALRDRDIEVATFKGVTAQARWYDHEGDRPCVDVDLLLAPHHDARIDEVIRMLQPDHPLAGKAQHFVATGRLQSIELQVHDTPVDVHFDLFKLGIASRQRTSIWNRTRTIATEHGEFRVLDAETALVQFLLHLNKDRFRWLLGYVDIGRIIEREELDWDAVAAIAAFDGLEVPVSLTLRAVTRPLGLDRAPLRTPRSWRATAWRRLWPPSIRLQGELGLTTHHLRQAALPALAEGRQREALRLWTRRILPPPALVQYRNPSSRGYVRGITLDRVNRSRARRTAARRLRRADAPDRSPAVDASKATG